MSLMYPDKTIHVLRKSAQSAGAMQIPLCTLIKQCMFCENLRNPLVSIQSPLCILIKQCMFCENPRNLRELCKSPYVS